MVFHLMNSLRICKDIRGILVIVIKKDIVEDVSKVPMSCSIMYAYLCSLKLKSLQIIEDYD